MLELTGDDRCGGSATTMSQISNVDECGFECTRAKGKMIHFRIYPSGPYCGCLKECSSNSYGTAAKQYSLITGMVIIFYETETRQKLKCFKKSKC